MKTMTSSSAAQHESSLVTSMVHNGITVIRLDYKLAFRTRPHRNQNKNNYIRPPCAVVQRHRNQNALKKEHTSITGTGTQDNNNRRQFTSTSNINSRDGKMSRHNAKGVLLLYLTTLFVTASVSAGDEWREGTLGLGIKDVLTKHIHLAPGRPSHSTMTVTFSTSEACDPFILLYSNDHPIRDKPRIAFGDDTRQYTSNNLLFNGSIADPYTSDWIHHVRINDLEAGSLYHYYCACASKIFEEKDSDTSEARILFPSLLTEEGLVKQKLNGGYFRTAPEPTVRGVINNESIDFAVCGDVGQTADSNSTLQHIAKLHDNGNGFAAILHAGDLSYSDGEQGRWDTWLELIDGIFSRRIPLLACPGNHEIETDGLTKEIFVPFQTRFGKSPLF